MNYLSISWALGSPLPALCLTDASWLSSLTSQSLLLWLLFWPGWPFCSRNTQALPAPRSLHLLLPLPIALFSWLVTWLVPSHHSEFPSLDCSSFFFLNLFI